MKTKNYINSDVLTESRKRIKYTFDEFERIFVSFSGGKDSTVMMHLVMEEAVKRKRKIGVMVVDFEAQYKLTEENIKRVVAEYKEFIDLYWVCLPIKLRNAVSTFEPTWTCWDKSRRDMWVREIPKLDGVISDPQDLPFFEGRMEFEEFIVLFADWYSQGKKTAAFIGIRADESLNRFRTIAISEKEVYKGKRWTTKVIDNCYNIYPIYDWKTRDIWIYHSKNPAKSKNEIYSLMNKAGVPLGQQRLCQPYGDDQRRGLWLYHIIEPETWYKIVARVNGANSGALYITERGNINGYNKISKPPQHTWKSYCMLLLSTMPKVTREHFIERFRSFIRGWRGRGYIGDIPDEAPRELETKHWVPSYRRLCKCLLRNDWWCKGLGLIQPKSEAYGRYLEIKNKKKEVSA